MTGGDTRHAQACKHVQVHMCTCRCTCARAGAHVHVHVHVVEERSTSSTVIQVRLSGVTFRRDWHKAYHGLHHASWQQQAGVCPCRCGDDADWKDCSAECASPRQPPQCRIRSRIPLGAAGAAAPPQRDLYVTRRLQT